MLGNTWSTASNQTSTATVGTYFSTTNSTAMAIAQANTSQGLFYAPPLPFIPLTADYHVADGYECAIKMPDGSIIVVKTDGSYVINDKDAKVTYRANRVREFNSYINASDKLEDFIRFCGEAGVRQDEMLNIPIKHFIAWLVVEAAQADGEKPAMALPDLRRKPVHCASCGRFMSLKMITRKLNTCRAACFERQLNWAG